MIGRSELKNLKRTTLNSFFEVCQKQNIKAGIHFNYNANDSIINIINGSQIILSDLFTYPSDPEFDGLGSLEITGAFVDEAPQISEKARNIVKSRIRYKLKDFNLIPKLLMCGNPSKNWAYNDFYKPAVNGSLRPDRQFVPAFVSDNPEISAHYVESLNRLDEASRQRLLLGNWEYDDDPSALINYDRILDCFTNDFVSGGTKYITADIARFGDDKTVICVWDGWRVKLFTYHGKSVTEVADIIRKLQQRFGVANSDTIADEDGIGGGVVDILACKGFLNNGRPIENKTTLKPENYNHLKSQCYFNLAERINNKGLYIECEDVDIKAKIIQELEMVKQNNMDKDGKKSVLPKDKVKESIGRSPDYSDALMMREFFELKPKWGVLVA